MDVVRLSVSCCYHAKICNVLKVIILNVYHISQMCGDEENIRREERSNKIENESRASVQVSLSKGLHDRVSDICSNSLQVCMLSLK